MGYIHDQIIGYDFSFRFEGKDRADRLRPLIGDNIKQNTLMEMNFCGSNKELDNDV